MYGVTAKGAGSCGDNNHWLSNHGCHGWTCCDHPNRFHVCVKSKTVKPAEPPRLCCLAMTADCLACSENMSVEEYCDLNPATVGCRFVKCPPLSCRMLCEHGYVQDKNGCDTCECITNEVEVCPERCISWYDGCNECKCESGEATFCTEKGCSLMEEAYCMKYEEEVEVCPEGCKTWYDGCNNCGCEGGEVTFCTLMGCSFKGDPYCAEYHEPDQGENEHCPEGCKTWYDGCNMCNCHSAMGPICKMKGCSVMEEAYCMEYGEPGPYEIPCITFFCDIDHGCDVVGADERGCGGICMCPEDPKEPCVAPLCEIGCDLVGADERGCGGECICAIVTEEPKEPCISTLCEIGCDLVGADERGCGGECICPSTKPKCHTWNQRDGYYVHEGHGVETDCYPTLDEAKTACLNTNGDCGAIAIQSNWCDGQYRVTHGGPTFSDFFDEWETYGLRSWELVATDCEEPCVMVHCLPGCSLVDTNENGCGGTCKCDLTNLDLHVWVSCISFDVPYSETCENDKDAFLTACTDSLEADDVSCYDCMEGSTIIIFESENEDSLKVVHTQIFEEGQYTIPNFPAMPLIGDAPLPPNLSHHHQVSEEVNIIDHIIFDITEPCDCPDGYGWNTIAKACKEGSTTSCTECKTMEHCETGSCHMHGCYGYMPHFTCQCTPACEEYDNCCSDQKPCSTCQEEEYCSEEVPCSTLCHPDQVCPCTCGHIPTATPTVSPSMPPSSKPVEVCDMALEQDFCGTIPCIDICDETACPCTCPPSEYAHLRNDTSLEFSIGGNGAYMAELNRFATRDKESASQLMFVTSNSVF